ncbi:MAG: efflux RND transporter periplasmic adaptor subunit [Reichenbachiella sp.]
MKVFLSCFLVAIVTYGCTSNEPKQLPPPKLPVVKVVKKNVPLHQQFVGQVYGLKDIPIRARVEGFLQGIHFTEGIRVKKGAYLYSIDPEPFKAQLASQQAMLAESRTMLANAENQLERVKPLAEINAVSQSDLDYAQANRDAASASVSAAKGSVRMAEINLSYCRIYSPITGFIGKTNARVGEFVGRDPNPVILNTISRIDTIRVQFFLTESEYLMVARYIRAKRKLAETNKKAVVKREEDNLSLILSDGSEHDYKGSVDFINREVDATTGAILVQASFPNPDLIIRPGQFARVQVEMDVKEDAILIPQRCVTELQGQFSVFVVGDSSKVETRQVKVGQKIDDMWLINEGLESGETVVLEGVQKVRSGIVIVPEMTEFKSVSSSL